jgi:hypothetical protein
MRKMIHWFIFLTALIGLMVAKADIAHAKSKLTVGELLNQVRDDSRGGKLQSMQKFSV